MKSLTQSSKLLPAQYLALERKAQHRSEYIDGYMYAMTGASRRHNQITFNIAGELGLQLKGRPCIAYISDMRVKVSATGLYAYPDIVALCGEAHFEDNCLDTLLNPMVIMEVLSESTEAYDRGEKFAHYRRLSSLSDYLLISQHKARIEHYVKRDKQWILTETDGLDKMLQLTSIGCRLALTDIYDKVDFPDSTEAL